MAVRRHSCGRVALSKSYRRVIVEWFLRLFSFLWDRDQLMARRSISHSRGKPRGAWRCKGKWRYHFPWWD